MSKRFNLGLFPRRQGGNHKIADVTVNLGSTKGRGSSTRMFNYCKQTNPQPWNCINQFINVSQSTPTPTPTPTTQDTILVYNTPQVSPFAWDTVIFTYDNTLPNYSYTAITTSIPASTVPSSNTLIGVTIGNTVTSIGQGAFINCTALSSLTFTPTSTLTTIGIAAFGGCNSLSSVTIPNSVTIIDSAAFNTCIALESVTIGNSVVTIGQDAFTNCTALDSVTIGNSVVTIGPDAFNTCSALTSITIPNSVTSIGTNAFQNSGLITVTISSATATVLGITSPTTNPPGLSFFGVTVATITP